MSSEADADRVEQVGVVVGIVMLGSTLTTAGGDLASMICGLLILLLGVAVGLRFIFAPAADTP